MTRFFSIVVAAIFLVSATVEIASFAIDHKSWFQENIKVVMEYFGPRPRSEEQMQPAQQVCEAACPTFQTANERRCEDIEELGKRVLCHISLPKSNAACRRECMQKNNPSTPRLRQDSKGKMASAEQFY